MKWFKLTLPPAQIASNQLSTLQDQFIELFMAGEEPRNMALFSTDSSPDTFYICASAASVSYVNVLTTSYDASPCHKPTGEKLNLLVGSAHGIDKLLQDTNS